MKTRKKMSEALYRRYQKAGKKGKAKILDEHARTLGYSIEFIRRAVEYKDEGHTFKELKETFKIPPETYYQWKQKLGNGYNGIKVFRERKRKIDKNELKKAVEEKPDAYLYELAEMFGCTVQAVFYALEKLKITRKKRPLPILKSPDRNARSL